MAVQAGGQDVQGSLDKALQACGAAAERWGANRRAMLLRARVLEIRAQMSQAGDARAAAEEYLQALTSKDMKPPIPAAQLEMARFQQRQRNWGQAAEGYAGFIRAVGQDAYVMSLVAVCLATSGDSAVAERTIREAEALQDFDAVGQPSYDENMLLNRAAVRAAGKRVDDVIADFDLFLKPYEKIPIRWVQRCLELDANMGSGRYDALMKDPKFQAYFKALDKHLREVIEREHIQIKGAPGQ
jgi:tetratricopeptide (TPR) repeat protein